PLLSYSPVFFIMSVRCCGPKVPALRHGPPPVDTTAESPAYNIVAMGTLSGKYSEAKDINSKGQIAGIGIMITRTASHGFLFDNGKYSDVGTLGGQNSSCYAINDYGQMVGSSDVKRSRQWHAFTYR